MYNGPVLKLIQVLLQDHNTPHVLSMYIIQEAHTADNNF